MIGNKNKELIKAIKDHKCCGSESSSSNPSSSSQGGTIVEANPTFGENDNPVPLTGLIVGEGKYTVPQSIVVEGSDLLSGFSADDGEPTFEDAVNVFKNGGNVTIVVHQDYYPDRYLRATDYFEGDNSTTSAYFAFYKDGDSYSWRDPDAAIEPDV